MWEFPMYEAEEDKHINTVLGTQVIFDQTPAFKLKHQFTHITWDIEVFISQENVHKDDIILPENMVWMQLTEKEDFNFPVSMTKIYNFITKHC